VSTIDTGPVDAELLTDVGAQRVARVYAEALYRAALQQNQTREVLEELDSLVRDVFPALPDLEHFLASGAISRERKPQVIRDTLGRQASPLFLNFLLVLNDHERLGLVRPILVEYRELYNRRTGHIRVLVRSAVPLPEDQQQRLRQELHALYHREPILDIRIQPDLLGGLVLQVGDWVYDGSVRSRLNNLRNQLIERSSYEIQHGRDRFRSD
jgi:F-type H+-transporting ATPase subunit delta